MFNRYAIPVCVALCLIATVMLTTARSQIKAAQPDYILNVGGTDIPLLLGEPTTMATPEAAELTLTLKRNADVSAADTVMKAIQYIKENDAARVFQCQYGVESDMTPEEFREKVKQMSEIANSGQFSLSVLDSKEAGDYAVAIVKIDIEGENSDINDWYLVRVGHKWKLLNDAQNFTSDYYGFDADQTARFHALKDWYRTRKKDFRK